MSEKRQQQAREIAIQVRDQCGSPAGGILERTVRRTIAAALEAVERETADKCAKIAGNEMVDAEDTGDLTDAAL